MGDRIGREYIANFADIQARSGLTSTELANFALRVILDKVREGDGLETYMKLAEHSAGVLADSAERSREILQEDFSLHQVN